MKAVDAVYQQEKHRVQAAAGRQVQLSAGNSSTRDFMITKRLYHKTQSCTALSHGTELPRKAKQSICHAVTLKLAEYQ